MSCGTGTLQRRISFYDDQTQNLGDMKIEKPK